MHNDPIGSNSFENYACTIEMEPAPSAPRSGREHTSGHGRKAESFGASDATRTPWVNSLPVEVLSRVMEYLPTVDVFNADAACNSFYRAATRTILEKPYATRTLAPPRTSMPVDAFEAQRVRLVRKYPAIGNVMKGAATCAGIGTVFAASGAVLMTTVNRGSDPAGWMGMGGAWMGLGGAIVALAGTCVSRALIGPRLVALATSRALSATQSGRVLDESEAKRVLGMKVMAAAERNGRLPCADGTENV